MEFILHFITRLHLYKVETFHIVTNCNPISDPTSFTSKHCLKSVQIRSFLWPVFSSITTEYGDLLYETPYSFQIQENTDRNKLGIWTLFMQRNINILPMIQAFVMTKFISVKSVMDIGIIPSVRI